MRRALWLMALIVGCSAACAASAQDIGWQEAVARLAHERTLAETCVALLKKYGHGDDPAIDRGRLAYDDAKAEYDGIIVGLDVALAQSEQPASLPDLEARLRRGFDKRQAFCATVERLVPPAPPGVKGPFADIVGGVLSAGGTYVRWQQSTTWLKSCMRESLWPESQATVQPVAQPTTRQANSAVTKRYSQP
jgi:hypothetical protein